MSDSFERGLRRAMEGLGRVVEAVIGKAKRAKVQVSTRGGVQPILSVESQLDASRIRELIEAASQKVISGISPELKGQNTLEIGEGPALFFQKFFSCHAATVIGVEMGGASVPRQGDASRGFTVRAQAAKLPFADAGFGYVLGRFCSHFAGDMLRDARELSRVMKPGGQGVVVDFHPFGMWARSGGGRVRAPDSGVHRIEDYYRLFRQTGLRIVDVREAFIDEGMRQHFKDAETSAYRGLKGTPILIFIFVYKPKG